MHRKLLLIPALALPALISHAADEDAEKSWKGSSELGYINTSGNTDTTSLNAKFGVMHSGENWDTTFKADALTSEEDGTTSKEKYASSLQFDRNFTLEVEVKAMLHPPGMIGVDFIFVRDHDPCQKVVFWFFKV